MNDEFLTEPPGSCTSLLCNFSLETLSSMKDEECVSDYASLHQEEPLFYSTASSCEPQSSYSFWNDTEPSPPTATTDHDFSYTNSAYLAPNSYCHLPTTSTHMAFATSSCPTYQPQQRHCHYYNMNRDYTNRYLPTNPTFCYLPTSTSHVRMDASANNHQMKKPCDSESFKLIEKLRPKKSRTKYSRSQVSPPISSAPHS